MFQVSETPAAPFDTDPFAAFDAWWQDGLAVPRKDANWIVLATASPQGVPSCRVVLLKSHSPDGFVFYTNYDSRKGLELTENPHASLLMFWEPIGRQIRVGGDVKKVSPAESDAYFATRERGSQIGAWASNQSQPIDDRATLEARAEDLEQRFKGGPVPRPPHWGGFRLVPREIEFWQAGASRLHDRLVYMRETHGWRNERLAP